MLKVMYIFLGGGFGAISRYGLSRYFYKLTNVSFPWGTFFINIFGAFFIGLFVNLFNKLIVPNNFKLFLLVGFLGAFTTFSTYTFESIDLLLKGSIRSGISNIVFLNLFALIATLFGIYSSRYIFRWFR
ncbi:fluoride efflux transporter CrcB [bacterium]|nr:fluoride efflux transporter CrcB [bacterium]